MTTGTFAAAIWTAWAAAPANGGSRTTAAKLLSSFACSGCRARSRCVTSIRPARPALFAAVRSADADAASPSHAATRARPASAKVIVPHPANSSAMRPLGGSASTTAATMAASPDAEACRKAPGGGVIAMPASDVVGGRRIATGSGSSMPCAQAMRGRAAHTGFYPKTLRLPPRWTGPSRLVACRAR